MMNINKGYIVDERGDPKEVVIFPKQMSRSITFDIKIGRIRSLDMPHNLKQISRRRLKQQVIMGYPACRLFNCSTLPSLI